MRRALQLLALVSVLTAPCAARAGVNVQFVKPESYTDADSYGPGSYESTVAFFRIYFQELGRALLRPGQALSIDVLNIDLAGTSQLSRSGRDVRVLTGATPPSFRLRYLLKEKGKPAQSGEELVADFNYQAGGAGGFRSERFGYEKTLLRDWFRRRFAADQF